MRAQHTRVQVLLFWLGHLKRVASCYGTHGLVPGLYQELLAAATRIFAAIGVLAHDVCGPLLASKVAPKMVDLLILVLDFQGGFLILGYQSADPGAGLSRWAPVAGLSIC